MSYPVNCPACGVRNDLGESDLGVTLKCGSCAEPFTYGAEILAERKRVAAERKRQEREEAARIAEQNRAAAEAVKVAAEIQAQAKAEEERERLAQYTPPDFKQPAAKRSERHDGVEVVASMLNVFGVIGIIASIIAPIGAAAQAATTGRGFSALDALANAQSFFFGCLMIGMGHGLRLLVDIARNTAR